MLIQLESQHLTIFKLKLEFLPVGLWPSSLTTRQSLNKFNSALAAPSVEPRIVPVDYPVVIGADDNDVGHPVILASLW